MRATPSLSRFPAASSAEKRGQFDLFSGHEETPAMMSRKPVAPRNPPTTP